MKAFRIKNILIPTDFSNTGNLAVEYAAQMAKKSNASLYLMHCVEVSEVSLGIYRPLFAKVEFDEAAGLAAKKLEEMTLSIQKRHGIKVKSVCASGKVYAAIAEKIKEKKIDLVVMGTHGASGFNEFFIGSNAQKIVAVSPVPVITVQVKGKQTKFTNIVLPIGDNFNSRQKVNAAVAIAKIYDARVHVLGLLDLEGDVDPLKFQVKLDSVAKVLNTAGVKFVTKLIRAGNLPDAALKYAKKAKADLMVVLTEEESQFGGMLFGAFTRQIVNHSKIPVMSVRPVNLGVHQFKSLPGFS